jgi:NADH dehydrogenase FAD-containing subunit
MPEHSTSDRKPPSVVVVGGGYGGIAVAKALDEVADVVLVDPKDSFEHNVAALRALVDPSWSSRIRFSYDGLLKRGRVIRDRAVASNIRALIDGEELEQSEPMGEVILVTVGPEGGAAQLPDRDDIAGPETAAQYKSRDMMVDRFRAMFDAAPSSE